MATVTFDHVYKRYGDVTAVSDFNLEISDGEFMVFVGPSGCGKTTSLRMIAGLEEITEGELRIGDKVVNDVAPKDRDIAMVFQSYALYPHMSVRDNLAFGLKLRKVPKADIDEADQRGRRHPPAREAARPQAQGALRRPAPARRARPGHRPRARRVPHGRAAVQPRRQAARPDPRRDRAPPPAPRDHDGLRHPRPGRGHDDGPADRGHEHGPPPAGRHARRQLYDHAEEPVRRRLHRQPVDELHGAAAGRRRAPTSVAGPCPSGSRTSTGRRSATPATPSWRASGRSTWSSATSRARSGPSRARRTSSSTSATRSSSTSPSTTRTSSRSWTPPTASARRHGHAQDAARQAPAVRHRRQRRRARLRHDATAA